jgi:hypothetical protein
MRTTLTLDDDVAALLEQVQAKRKASLKEVVNTALRSGLIAMSRPAEKDRTPFRTKLLPNGPRSIPNIDNVAEVLAAIEGEDYK